MSAMEQTADSKEIDVNSDHAFEVGSGQAAVVTDHTGQFDGHDPNITFEEYLYYANWTRQYERGLSTVGYGMDGMKNMFSRKAKTETAVEMDPQPSTSGGLSSMKSRFTRKGKEAPASTTESDNVFGVISDYEWHHASRAARTATWGSVFYLITTDILGPFSVPWALSQLGYGPGVALYFVFGALAAYAGLLLWKQFIGLDSDKYPVKNYGDLAFRIFGNWARYIVNVLQSCQFFLNVCLLIVSNGQGISQLSDPHTWSHPLCFVVCMLVFTIAGAIIGQIRTLQNFGYLANSAVWMNVFIICMTMGVVCNSSPNYKAVYSSYGISEGKIVTSGGLPSDSNLRDNINGLMQAVFSYGGATLFCELMAEMRRPWDFWKGMVCAETFIFVCYIVFGLVVYSQQGQFSYNPAYQGINPYAWQTVGNILSLLSGLIAACLYGNIGIKVLYAQLGRGVLHFPPLESTKGKWIWVVFVPVYWFLAFIVGAAVPQISNLSAFVGAAMILQFSYTFPPIMMVGFNVLKDSMTKDDSFDPTTGTLVRSDGGMQRILRGYRVKIWENSFNIIFFLGSVVTAVLGMYSSIYAMNQTFNSVGAGKAFSCDSPTG